MSFHLFMPIKILVMPKAHAKAFAQLSLPDCEVIDAVVQGSLTYSFSKIKWRKRVMQM